MSLQDQLLKAGLVDAKKAQKVKKSKHKQAKLKQKNKVETVDEAKLAAQRAQQEKAERDRLLNQQRKAEAEQKAVAAQIRQLVAINRQPHGEGEITYRFTDGTAIKQLYIDAEQQRQLGLGRLVIIALDGAYELLPAGVVEKIRQRDESVVVLSNAAEETSDEDDPYAEFQVPDDLMW